MRQVISFVLASALFATGAYWAYFQLLEAARVRGLFLLAAGAMIAAGGIWLGNDFLLPLMRRRQRD